MNFLIDSFIISNRWVGFNSNQAW